MTTTQRVWVVKLHCFYLTLTPGGWRRGLKTEATEFPTLREAVAACRLLPASEPVAAPAVRRHSLRGQGRERP